MNTRIINYLSWVALALALFAWVGVVVFGWTIAQAESDRTQRLDEAKQSAMRYEASVRARALAQDTASARTHLDSLLNVDVISAANAIEAAGKAANVDMQLGGAQPEAILSQSPNGPVQAIGFAVSGQGNFPSLVRALEFLETLPLPSSVDRFDLTLTPGSGTTSSSWHLNAYVRVFTTAPISS